MRQSRLFLLLLTPSVSSLIGYLIAVAALFVSTAWHQLSGNQFVHTYTELGRNVPSGVRALTGNVANKSIVYDVVLLAAALVITLGVYLVLRLVEHGLAGALDIVSITRSAQPSRERREMRLRYLLQIVAFVGWIVYFVFTVGTMIPVCLVGFKTGLNTRTWGSLVYSAVLLMIGLHVHVVLLRLMFLRPRLFGGGNAFIASGAA